MRLPGRDVEGTDKYNDYYNRFPNFEQKRHSELEQKYLTTINRYSDRLRLAAALQADIYPQKVIYPKIKNTRQINNAN